MPQVITVQKIAPGQSCSIGDCQNPATYSLGATIRVKLGFISGKHAVNAPICDECKSQLQAGLNQ